LLLIAGLSVVSYKLIADVANTKQ